MTACYLCDTGFPICAGVHYGTQRLGMISNTPCEHANFWAVHLGNATDINKRPWIAYLRSNTRTPLLKANGVPRRFTTKEAALEAGHKATTP